MDMLDLKRARSALKMTQAEVARQVGVSLATYLVWERGVGNPNKENLEKLMRVMGAEWGRPTMEGKWADHEKR